MTFTITTTNDSTLQICSTKCTVTDHNGTRDTDDEITLVIEDLNNESEANVSLSKESAIQLARKLLQIVETIKSY